FCRGLVMTACLDALDFYSPISSNEVVTFKAGLNHVGTSSLEVAVKRLTEAPWTGQVRHACTAYLTFVPLGMDMRPRPCPTCGPGRGGEGRRGQGALEGRNGRRMRGPQRNGALYGGRFGRRVWAFSGPARRAGEWARARAAGAGLPEGSAGGRGWGSAGWRG